MSTTSPDLRRRGAKAAAAAAVVAVAAAGAVFVSMRGEDAPVIRIVSDGGNQGTPEAVDRAAAELGAESSMLAPVIDDFALADSARIDAGAAAAWRLVPPSNLRDAAARLARFFDLGDATPSPYDDGFSAGAVDGSGPSLWVGTSGDWWFGDPGGQPFFECVEPGFEGVVDRDATFEGRGSVGDTGGEDVEIVDGDAGEPDRTVPDEIRCAEPTPPEGVPSSADARSMATALFAELGTPGDLGGFEAFADEWGAWVYAQVQVGGMASAVGFSAGYGADGRLTSAGGTVAKLERVGEYPTVDADTAVERLRQRNLGWGRDVLLERGGSASLDAAVSSDVAIDAPTAEEPAVLVDPLPGGEMKTRTVTLVDVEPTLTVVFDVDDVMWLVPAYRFTADDGGIWEVMAIADGFVEFDTGGSGRPDVAEPPPVEQPEPLPVDPPTAPSQPEPDEPDPVDGDVNDQPIQIDPGPGEEPPPPLGLDPELEAVAVEVVGLQEDEALGLIRNAGAVARVVARDGESFMVTEDYRLDRVNLTIENGVVLDAYIG